MATLEELLLSPENRPKVVADCVQLVDDEVAGKSGLTGMAVKAGYAVVKKIKPGIIREAVEHLLGPFVASLEPFWQRFANADAKELETSWSNDRTAIANALLSITDAKIARAENKTIKAAYGKLRPTGLKHTESAVPGVARIVAKYAR